jgi:hypothetical protein
VAKHSMGGGRRHYQTKVGSRVAGRNCEGFPAGGVMSLGAACTEALKRKGNYGKFRWNNPERGVYGAHVQWARLSPAARRALAARAQRAKKAKRRRKLAGLDKKRKSTRAPRPVNSDS